MKKKLKLLLMLAAMLFAGCATNKPKAPEIRYTFMILPKGKLRGFPLISPVDPELDAKNEDLAGGMCLKLSDWEAREQYIMDLEAHGK
jgi:hypothetical protein